MIKDKDAWQKAFEKQMDIAERKTIPVVKRYYKAEYKKAAYTHTANIHICSFTLCAR